MKTLYLCRHAKSSWADPGMDDFDRPLNERGLRNAPFMASTFKQRGEPIDRIVSSPALRAKTTARAFVDVMKVKDYSEDRAIYHADVPTLLRVVNALPNDLSRVMLFGHEPGSGQFLEYLTEAGVGPFPTCGLVRIDLTVDNWAQVGRSTGTMVWFDYPKRYPDQS